jgi:hypothetical protein
MNGVFILVIYHKTRLTKQEHAGYTPHFASPGNERKHLPSTKGINYEERHGLCRLVRLRCETTTHTIVACVIER